MNESYILCNYQHQPGCICGRTIVELLAKVQQLELQNGELKTKLQDQESITGDYLQVCKQRDDALRLNGELHKKIEEMKLFLPHDGRPCYGPGCHYCEETPEVKRHNPHGHAYGICDPATCKECLALNRVDPVSKEKAHCTHWEKSKACWRCTDCGDIWDD